MLLMLSRVIGSIVLDFAGIFIAGKILNKSNTLFKNKNNIIYIFIMGVITTYIYLFTDDILRAGLNLLIMSYGIKIIFKNNDYKNFAIAISIMIMALVAEVMCVLFTVYILGLDFQFLTNNIGGKIYGNVASAIILLIIYSMFEPKLKQMINNKSFAKVSNFILLIACFFFLVNYSFYNFKGNSCFTSFVFNEISIFTMITLLYLVFFEKLKNKIANDEKQILNKNIIIYENTVEKLRISQHENKNEIAIIKNLISKNNDKLKKYLEELLSEKKVDEDVEVVLKFKPMKSVLIKSLLYEKTNQIYNRKINLIVDANIQEDSLINKLDIHIEKDICKIVGSLIDNAVDCVETKSNYNMGIILFSDKNSINFDIFNNYDSMNFLIPKPKTKISFFPNLKTRGNGLKLVNKIVQKYSELSFKTELDNEYVSQKIIYKKHTW